MHYLAPSVPSISPNLTNFVHPALQRNIQLDEIMTVQKYRSPCKSLMRCSSSLSENPNGMLTSNRAVKYAAKHDDREAAKKYVAERVSTGIYTIGLIYCCNSNPQSQLFEEGMCVGVLRQVGYSLLFRGSDVHGCTPIESRLHRRKSYITASKGFRFSALCA